MLVNQSEKKRIWVQFGLSFLLLFLWMWLSPLVSDDLEFEALKFTSFGDFWDYALYYGNGRFLGNILGVAMARSILLKALIRALVIALIPLLLSLVLRMKTRPGQLLCLLLVIGVQPEIFGQVYSWTSGFANYTPPILLTLLILHLILNQGEEAPPREGARLILIALLGLSAQLFVEHNTLIQFLLAAILYFFARKGSPALRGSYRRKALGVWLLSALAGGGLMFLLPRLFYRAGNRAEGYQQLPGSLQELIAVAKEQGHYLIKSFMDNRLMLLLFCCIFLVLLYGLFSGEAGFSLKKDKKMTALLLVLAASWMLLWFRQIRSHGLLLLGLLFLSFGTTLAIILLAESRREKKGHLYLFLLLLALSLLTLLPFLLVSPCGHRNVYLAYLFFISFLLLWADRYLVSLSPAVQKKISLLLAAGLLALSAYISLVFIRAYGPIQERTPFIQSEFEKGASSIPVFEIDDPYLHDHNYYAYRRIYYRQSVGDILFPVIDWEEWQQLAAP